MIIDHDKRYVFVAVPKTASISIHFSLGHGNDIPEPDLYHRSLKSAIQSHPEIKNYFKFGICRNPWARLVSLYYDFTLKRKTQYSGKVVVDKPLFSEFKDFTDFCKNIKKSKWWDNIFLKSQHELLFGSDYIGRFERLESDFQYICQQIGVTAPLLKHNLGVYDKNYREYFTDETQKLVTNELYPLDVEQFGYKFEE